MVKDNGRGIERPDEMADSARYGVGLTGILERFELLGGSLEIDSTPGTGSSVIASVPLEQGKQEESE